MSPDSRKTWISIVIAAVISVGILAAAAVGGTAFFFYRHVRSQSAPPEQAETQFAEARAKFAGQKALIEIQRGDEPRLHRELLTPASASAAQISALRVLAYDQDGEKLVNVTVPFWLLRLAPTNRKLSFLSDNGIDFDNERVRLTLEDLERRGPGLVLDAKDRRGAQVLVWTE
jgi:hypothetical protein